MTWEMSLMTSRLSRLARNHDDWAKRKSPASTATRVPYKLLMVCLPRRISHSSSTSSCTRLAVWIISTISASLRCFSVMSGSFMRFAVALATRNTMTGRSFFPPAPKICSAAAMSIGWRLPTTFFRLVFISSKSSFAGATAAVSTSAGGGVATTVGVGEVWLGRPFSFETLSVRAGVITLRWTARLCIRWRCAILGLAELMR
mmetsp:Transcript_28502/g.72513  ORF Transcript_28502/g.72513 Transcript_28502/m.72513 type:complete len:202 (+) Transcript_28502:1374-1979(+)